MDQITVQITDVAMRYGRRKLFRGISGKLTNGQRVAIVGPNGSGKTTLLKILAGLERPTSGEVTVQINQQIIEENDRPLHFGFVGPYLNLYDRFTLRENLSFIARVRGIGNKDEHIATILEQVQLPDRGDELLSTYSSGMKQRARWAQALMTNPACLMLDEPFSNLDSDGKRCFVEMMANFTKAGGLILLATNETAEADLCSSSISIAQHLS